MPIQHAIWKIGPKPIGLTACKLLSEQQLEEMIVSAPEIISEQWMLIGRQEVTSHGGRIDLLAIAPDASLVLIELKRNKTPREIVAQAIDYATWVESLTSEKVAQIYLRFAGSGSLNEAFKKRFGSVLDEDELNASHQIVIVASELDASTERILGYLNARDIAINALFFQVFDCGGEKLLSRAWLMDPIETQVSAMPAPMSRQVGAEKKEPWNGEFYVSFGGYSSWDDARRFGFISAGGGSWYTQTLKLLSAGDRVWINIPGTGYVGVGRVRETVQPVEQFEVQTPSGLVPILDAASSNAKPRFDQVNPENSEHFVRVDWLDCVAASEAFKEIGLFGSQHTVCQPTAPKWRHTLDRLKIAFPNWNANDRPL